MSRCWHPERATLPCDPMVECKKMQGESERERRRGSELAVLQQIYSHNKDKSTHDIDSLQPNYLATLTVNIIPGTNFSMNFGEEKH